MEVQTDMRTHLDSGLSKKRDPRCTHVLSESGHLGRHRVVTFAGEDHKFFQWISPGDSRVMHVAFQVSDAAHFQLLHRLSLQSERTTARFSAQEDLYP